MRKILLSFADEKYRYQQTILNISSKLYFDEIINVGPEDIEEEFIKENKEIFDHARGYGYWIWKPYFIRRVLNYINDGDILFYVDSGNELIANPHPLFNLLQNQDIILFKNRDSNNTGDVWINSTWTKADCFNLMECNEEKYKKGPQVDGSYVFLKKTLSSIQFIDEYLKYSCNKNIITDLPNITGNNELDFRDHRHDQSVLSLLAIKHNIPLFESPSESSNHIQKEYPQIFNHFRRNLGWSQTLKSYFIYSHMGLGDHIILNGLIRSIVKPNIKYFMFVKYQNQASVEFMYQDIPNLTLFPVVDDNEVNYWLECFQPQNLIKIGFNSKPGLSWDEFFYYQHNVDFNNRWSNFRIKRDVKKEKELYKILNPNDEEFILIHSKGSDNVDRIDYSILNNGYKKIFVDKHTDNIFDYLLLVEKAKEIHCVESSFHVLVDSVDLNNNLFFHTLKNSRGFKHKIKNKWKIV